MTTILEDKRPIKGLTNERQGCNFAWVGQGGVTRIEAYGEPGHMAMLPWFAVWHDDHLAGRVSADHVAVVYEGGAE